MTRNIPQIRTFDFFGFAMLAVAVGALQLFLDRGERQDWFSSVEIWIELGVCVGAFWMFIVHLMTSRDSFLDRRLFLDRNFSSAMIVAAVVGAVMVGIGALMPPMLQNLMGYSTVDSGFVLAPRGLGTMIVMLFLGRFSKLFDPRILLAFGLVLTVVSSWWLTQFAVMMGWWPIVLNGLMQGAGIGFLFAPLSLLSLSTISGELRTQAAGIFSLMRNIGGSIGLSVLSSALSQNLQTNHAQIAEHVSPFNPEFHAQATGIAALIGAPYSASVMAMMDMEVNRQALMIAYLNDFKLVMWLSLASIPLLLLLRTPAHGGAPRGPGANGDRAKGGKTPSGPVVDLH